MTHPAVPDWHPAHRLAATLSHRLTAFLGEDPSGVTAPDSPALAAELRSHAARLHAGRWLVDGPFLQLVAVLHHARALALGDRAELATAVELFALLGKVSPEAVPRELRPLTEAMETPEVDDLSALGARAIAAYTRWGTTLAPEALDEAVAVNRHVRDALPPGHPGEPMALANLCAALRDRAVLRDAGADLDEAVEAGRTAVRRALPGDPHRGQYHGNLAGALVALSARDPGVLDEAVVSGREATADPRSPALFHAHLGLALLARATLDEEHPSPADLDEAIDALGTASRAEPHVPRHLSHLGMALHARFATTGDPDDLSSALEHTERAVHRTPPAGPELFVHLTNHVLALSTRARHTGAIEDLDALVDATRRLVEAAPEPLRADRMRALALVLGSRFEVTGDVRDSDETIEVCRQALELGENEELRTLLDALTSPKNTPTGSRLLSEALRAWESGDDDRLAELLEHAIPALRREDTPAARFNLARALDLSYERTDDPALLDESVVAFEAALKSLGPGHPERATTLSALGVQIRKRGLRRGDAAELDRAVRVSRESVEAAQVGDPDRAGCLTHLAAAHAARYELLMTEADLAEAIRAARDAVVALTPGLSAQERSVTWNNLGMLLRRSHERSHALADLNEAIDALRTAVETAPGGTVAGNAATNLTLALSDLYDRTGGLADLDEAVDAGRLAVGAYPAAYVHRPGALTNLAFVLSDRARTLGRRGDADEAVRYGRAALDGMDPGHPYRTKCLAGLGTALMSRYEVAGDAADLTAAADVTRQSLDALPEGDWRRVSSLVLLGQTHTLLAVHTLGHLPVSGLPRLADGMPLAELPRFIGRLPASTSAKAGGLLHVAGVLRTIGLSRLSDSVEASAVARLTDGLDEPGRPALRAALAAYREAAAVEGVPAKIRFSASALWGLHAALLADWQEALTAYRVAVAQLPALAWHGLELEDRISGLAVSDSIACDAAAAALHLGLPDTALHLLEQGRGILLAQAVDTRFDLAELAEYDPGLSARIEEFRAALEDTTDARRRRELAAGLDAATADAYRVLGLDALLTPPTSEELRESAADGAVVVVNTSLLRCDALVVTRDAVRVVPLPDLDLVWVKEAAESLLSALSSPRTAGEALRVTLGNLEFRVLEPVLDALPPEVTRLWWCPTGPLALLPLHAATPARFVCSYATTLRSLTEARTQRQDDTPGPVLVVDQATVPDLAPLPGARKEAIGLVTRLTDRTLLTGPKVTPPALRKALPHHTCLHFAGHARHNAAHPGEGGLHCQGGLLTVETITRLRLPRADLAFLSACETARGTERLPDEPVHLSGALQLAGFTHVVATQWMARDDITRQLTERFYAELCPDGRPDPARAAFALHSAVREIRELHDDPLLWAAYVHTGP
ncbi:CHAT domain-containing protein [Streptomyces sp. NPDC004539]|uniref:CHAT domain-containing protein n=1 Tax=Streptomyces sp. NPDC004539 TaxID=3154280 RepID=UPI0033B62D28